MDELKENRFCAYKVTIDGNQDKFDFIHGLTFDEMTNPERFTFGIHKTEKGVSYVWGGSLS